MRRALSKTRLLTGLSVSSRSRVGSVSHYNNTRKFSSFSNCKNWKLSERKVYVIKNQQPTLNQQFKRTLFQKKWHEVPPKPIPSEDIDAVAFDQRLDSFRPDSKDLESFLSSGVPALMGNNETAYGSIFKKLIALGKLDYVPDVLVRAKEAGLPLRANLVEPIFYHMDKILDELSPGEYLDDAINMVNDIIAELEGDSPDVYEKQYRLLYELLDVDPKYIGLQRNLLDNLLDLSDDISDLWMRCAVKTCAADEDQQFRILERKMLENKTKLDLQYYYELFCVYEDQGRHKQMAVIASEIIEQAKDKITPQEREDIRARLEKVGVVLDDWITIPELKSTYKPPAAAAPSSPQGAPSSGAPPSASTTPPPAGATTAPSAAAKTTPPPTASGAPSGQAPKTSEETAGSGAKPVGTSDKKDGLSGPPGTQGGSPKENAKASSSSGSGEQKTFGKVQAGQAASTTDYQVPK